MIESDVNRIEDAFNLTLPADYRHLLLHFPVRFSAGTTEQPLWDDADALISRNRELRTERKSLGVQYHPIPNGSVRQVAHIRFPAFSFGLLSFRGHGP
jgi:hypothetical protein